MPTVRYTNVHGEVLAEKRGGVRKWYVPDPLGSTMALLDSSQAKTDTFSYWPYGEVKDRTGTTATPLQFVGTQGYYRDKVSRVYVVNRYLRVDIGRWLTMDPIALPADTSDSFTYVYNRPTLLADPSGLWCPVPHSVPPPCPEAKPTLSSYGCYCGSVNPYRLGKQPNPQFPLPVNPWDPVDGCCASHDYSYYIFNCQWNPPDKRMQCVRADKHLCNCARNRSCKGSRTKDWCNRWRDGILAFFCRLEPAWRKWNKLKDKHFRLL